MSPIIGYTEKDLLMGKIVDPAWYQVLIESVDEKMSKDGNSTNYPVTAKILRNVEDGSTTFAGVPIIWNFNSKAIGLSRGFMEAIGESPEAGKRYELSAAVGRTIRIYIGNKLFEGRTLNDVPHRYKKDED